MRAQVIIAALTHCRGTYVVKRVAQVAGATTDGPQEVYFADDGEK